MKQRLFSLAAALLLTICAPAQDSRGTIVGTITDTTDALVPNAEVIVTNAAMGTRLKLTSNAEGLYVAPLLNPGMYKVEVSAPGFKKAVRNDVELRVADRLNISFRMEVGGGTESVTITAEAPLLNSESASLGTVIDSKRLASLPVSYGNPFLLIGLTAGVTFNGSTRLDRPFEPTHIVNFAMGGTRGNLNDITIDGAPTTATANANEVTASYVPPTDIVQEFKVQTNTFDAQFGQTQGGVTNISIKSGTNSLHGTAGYSFQRPDFWANDFFLNKNGTPRPDFSFNRWTGSISGPVVLPKIYNGKNKTFFLFGYEWISDSRPRHDDTTNTIPTPAMLQGDFSALLAAGSQYTIYDPATRVAAPNGRFSQTAFPGNKIPLSRFDPVGKAIASYYPTTEKSQGDAVGVGNYRDATTTERTDPYWNQTTRLDQNINDRQRFFVRYSSYNRSSTYNNYFDNAFVGDQFFFISKTASFDHVYTISPTMLLNTRYSYNRYIRRTDQPASAVGFDLASLGFSQHFINQIPEDVRRFPRINYASASYISNGHTNENRPVMNHTLGAMLTKSAGKHSLRTGIEYRAYQETDQFKSNQQTLNATFGTTWTRGPLDNAAGAASGYGQSVAALLLGLPDTASVTRAADYAETSGVYGIFIQDDFKVAPRLTLNLGLRYEVETPMTERYNRSTLDFDRSYVQPISAAAQTAYSSIYPGIAGGFAELPPSAFALRGGMTFAGINGNGRGLYNTPKNIFLPRLGIAYQLNSKTVIRAGAGIFAGFLGERRGDVIQNGFNQNTNMILTTDSGLTFINKLSDPFPTGITEPVGASKGYQTFLGQTFNYFNQNPKVPMTNRWEISLQREFRGYLFETNYIGNKTNHIELTRDINTLPAQYLSRMRTRDDANNNYMTANIANPLRGLDPGNTQGIYTSANTTRQTLLSPYVAFGSSAINTTENTGYSWYHGFTFTGSKRFSKGYTLVGSYTFQKWQQAINLLNPSDPAPVREMSDQDSPHRINISGVWALPFGKGRALMSSSNPVVNRLVGGWEMSGIYTIQSGFPLIFNNSIFYGTGNILLPADQRTVEHWFDITGFEQASAKQLLSNQVRWFPRNFGTIRGPRINNLDLSLVKKTMITEGKEVEFRAEALNAANHPLFPNPNMTVTTAQNAGGTGFGQINASTMNNYARRLQLTLRFVF